MPRIPRNQQFDPNTVGILHCIQRCVRRAFLAGVDPVSGKDYSFRREWIRARMERLASVFGVDVLTYAILSNHLHVVIRNRPDIVKSWSDRDVALKWLRIFPGRRIDEQLADPTNNDVESLAKDPERMQVIRSRLSDPSWYMKALCEPIARMANHQDEVTGHFWEGRFKAIAITDEAALLACSVYVDLNPIRAALAQTPEQAIHTSAYDRLHALQGATISSAAAELVTLEELQAQEAAKDEVSKGEASNDNQATDNTTNSSGSADSNASNQPSRSTKATHSSKSTSLATSSTKKSRGDRIARDAWLVPLEMDTKAVGDALPSKLGFRASDQGFLAMPLQEYLELLDWTGRQKGPVNKATIPEEFKPILQRLGIDAGMWVDLSVGYMKYYGHGRAAGSPRSMKAAAESQNLKFVRGQRAVAECFTSRNV